MLLNKYLVRLLLQMYKQGQITRKTQNVYISTLGFYAALKFLKNNGMVECAGVDNKNMKIWKLTDKGVKLVEHLIEIRKLFGVSEDG